ncbi:protein FAM83D [Genypterus blacodes]|uniref:protein FAM83D n=1 Tax=Genypterus blacodes TaxID=154954 RepID=UPI003F7637B7
MSQCLEDSPMRWGLKKPGQELNLQEVYNERHRLALEELLSGGVDSFQEFLRKEKIPNFLSDDEAQQIRASAVPPRCVSVLGEDTALLESVSSSMDCSSVTYFPDLSDVEPPVLDIGWPAFTSGSYRGVTRAVAYFQPSYEQSIYSCKEAARRLIKSAREVIAIATDSLTDLDIFRDLQEACSTRKVPVYILLDQSCAPAFLKMCRNLNVRLDDLQQMRVRTITGPSYCMRSGARITGKVHERFMLIDGSRVATGSYRFNWTDGKLNSSNLIELSGQIAEKFDEEFRILYASSLPINTCGPPSVRNSGIFEHLLIKHQSISSLHKQDLCLTSTPNRKARAPSVRPADEASSRQTGGKSSPASDSSTIGEDWGKQEHIEEEILAGSATQHPPVDRPVLTEPATPSTRSCHIATQTNESVVDSDTQTDAESLTKLPQHPDLLTSITTPDPAAPQPNSTSPRPSARNQPADCGPPTHHIAPAIPESNLRECFHKLTKERQHRYANIRTKMEHMMTVLSQRQEIVGNITNVTEAWRTHLAEGAGRARETGAQAAC